MRVIHPELTQLANRYIGLNTAVVFDREAMTEEQRNAAWDALEKLERELDDVTGGIPVMVTPFWRHLLESARAATTEGDGPTIEQLRNHIDVVDGILASQRRKEELEAQLDRVRRQIRQWRFVLNTLESDHAACQFVADTAEKMKDYILAAKAEMEVAQ